MLMSDLVDILPTDKVILEILETVDIANQGIIERLFELKKRGFKLALDDVVSGGAELEPLRGIVDVVKLDLKQISLDALPALVMQFKLWPVRVLAEKIDSPSQAQRCLDLGIDMFQGYYFARPEIISGRRLDPTKVALLRLLSMVLSDASDLQIEAELKRHPELIFNLPSIANSVAYGTGKKVISLRQCLAASLLEGLEETFTVNRVKLTPRTSRRMRLSGKYYTRYFLYEFRTSQHRQAARTFFRITPYGRKRRVKGMCPVPIKIERQRHHADQLVL
jgi:c-di-GMP-related signal transduction protein